MGASDHDGLSERLSSESQEYFDPVVEPSPKTGKRFAVYLALLGTLILVVVLAVVLAIWFVVIKPKSHVDSTSAGSSGGGNSGSSGGVIVSTVSGRFYVSKESIVSNMATNGPSVVTNNGTQFTYFNPFEDIV